MENKGLPRRGAKRAGGPKSVICFEPRPVNRFHPDDKTCPRCVVPLTLPVMRLLDRYLFRELFASLAYCLGGFMIFWISYDLFTGLEDMQERKLHLLDVLEYVVAMVPEYLVTVLPVSLLLGLLYTLTHHARHNEITAMRAAGVSLWRLSTPYFLVGFLASIALFVLNEFCVPHSTNWANHILNRHVQKSDDLDVQDHFTGFINAREHRLWQFSEYHARTTEMLNPIVSWTLTNNATRLLKADRAFYTNGVWTFFGVKEFEQTSLITQPFPSLQTNVLVMPQFTETPRQIESEIKISSYQNLHVSHKADIPLADILDYLKLHPQLSRTDSAWLLTELHARLAAPWTCLVVVLIAIPFGAAAGRRNLFVGVAGSIFICFAFFVLQRVGLVLGLSGWLPAWLAAWMPNLFFGVAGLWMMARVR
jgi:lipopolysaccharide export system permease protein